MQFMGKEDVEEKHVKRTQKDYTLDFKLRVVRELETSHISMNAISRKYGIQGESTVSRWLEKYDMLMQNPKESKIVL